MMTDSENIERGLFVALEHPEALTEPEELLKAYSNSTNIGLCLLDSGFRYLAINRTLAAIHGLPVEAHLGKTVREVLGDLGDLLEPKFQQAIETKKPITSRYRECSPPKLRRDTGSCTIFQSRRLAAE